MGPLLKGNHQNCYQVCLDYQLLCEEPEFNEKELEEIKGFGNIASKNPGNIAKIVDNQVFIETGDHCFSYHESDAIYLCYCI